jgi:hypothetical protein
MKGLHGGAVPAIFAVSPKYCWVAWSKESDDSKDSRDWLADSSESYGAKTYPLTRRVATTLRAGSGDFLRFDRLGVDATLNLDRWCSFQD